MLAKKDEIFEDAAHTIYEISQDDMIRMQIQAREDFNRDQRAYQHWVEKQNRIQKQALEKVQSDLAETKEALEESSSSLAVTRKALKESEDEVTRLKQILVEHGLNSE